MSDMEFAARVNAQDYDPSVRHSKIFEIFESLAVGEKMELTNDHDPKGLLYQFMVERNGQFTWDYLEEGPVVWRVAIGRAV